MMVVAVVALLALATHLIGGFHLELVHGGLAPGMFSLLLFLLGMVLCSSFLRVHTSAVEVRMNVDWVSQPQIFPNAAETRKKGDGKFCVRECVRENKCGGIKSKNLTEWD